MSILINGVSMPKDGKVLLIDPWGNVRLYWSKDVVAVGTGLYLCKASELPPHGRAIDADKLGKSIQAQTEIIRKWGIDELTEIADLLEKGFLQEVENADIILPAEGVLTDE